MITVLLATYNGERTIARTLDAFCAITPPHRGWECVIVDNASCDNTFSIIESFRDRLPLRCLRYEPRGKNGALNFGLMYATGSSIVFTDDDVLPDADWLCVYERAESELAEFDVFGGSIRPDWEEAPADWLLECLRENKLLGIVFAINDNNRLAGPVDSHLIWGPNMMIRRRVFDFGLRFDETIGPSAGQYIMGGETDFSWRAAKSGFQCGFVPGARVKHIVRAYQLEPHWILRRAFRFGKSVGLRKPATEHESPVPKIFGFPRWVLRQIVTHKTMAYCGQIVFNRKQWLVHSWWANYYLGQISNLNVPTDKKRAGSSST